MTDKGTYKIIASALIVLLLAFVACTGQQGKAKKSGVTAVQDSIAVIPFKTELGWGYRLNIGSRTLIYQNVIPALQGRLGFRSREDALKVGELAASKLRQHPKQLPSVSWQELADLQIPEALEQGRQMKMADSARR